MLRKLTVLACTCLLISLLITIDFWRQARLFPLVPLFGFKLSSAAAKLLLLVLIGSLTVLALVRLRQLFLLVPCLCLLVLIAEDQSRLQPYIYMSLTTLIVLSAARPDRLQEPLADALRIVCASAYFWSGVQKMNMVFYTSTFEKFVSPISRYLPIPPDHAPELFGAMAVSASIFEMLIGLFLFLNVRRWIPLAMAGLMLLVVLASLGPWGANWNIVVWAWNIELFATTLWLFARDRTPARRLFELRWQPLYAIKGAVIALFALMPVLGIPTWVDAFLSFKLYSDNYPHAYVLMPPQDQEKLPPKVRLYIRNGRLWLGDVTFRIYNIAPAEERRVYFSVWDQWCARYGLTGSTMIIHSQTTYFGLRDRREAFGCPRSRQASRPD